MNKQKTFQIIKQLEHDNQYLENLQFILREKQLPTPSSVANGLYNLRKIKSTRSLIAQEKQLLNHLIDYTYTMEQPKNVLCEMLRDVRQLGIRGDHIIDQILSRSEQFSEQGCAHVLATFQHVLTSKKDQQLLENLDQQCPLKFSQLGRLKIMKIFSTQLPWYNTPFYRDPQLLRQCFNSIKSPIEQQALIYVFDAYRFLPQYYERALLNSSVLQFEQNFQYWQSSLENLIHFYEILYSLHQLNLNLDYDDYFKFCVNTIAEKQFSYQSSLEQFTHVFIDRITEKNQEDLRKLWEYSIKIQHIILNKGISELFIKNQHLLPEGAINLLKQKNALQLKQYIQKFSVYNILGIKFTLDKAKSSLILRSLNRSYISSDQQVYEELKQIPNFSKFCTENLEECILTIQSQQTYDFMKQNALPNYNNTHENMLREHMMKFNDYYPRRYNQYQCKFILDMMIKLNVVIETAPFFYKAFKDPLLEQHIKKSDKLEIIRLQQ